MSTVQMSKMNLSSQNSVNLAVEKKTQNQLLKKIILIIAIFSIISIFSIIIFFYLVYIKIITRNHILFIYSS